MNLTIIKNRQKNLFLLFIDFKKLQFKLLIHNYLQADFLNIIFTGWKKQLYI